MKLLLDVFRSSGAQPVEDVIVPLLLTLRADTGLLQQVMGHETPYYCILENKSALPSNKRVTSQCTNSHISTTTHHINYNNSNNYRVALCVQHIYKLRVTL